MAKQTKKQVSPLTWVWVDQENKTMNVKKQSSIDWLVEQLKPVITLQEKYINEFLQQAKAMHKEEIMETFEKGYVCGHIDNGDEGIDYYKETFKEDK